GRLEEAIEVIRALWAADGPIDFAGDFFNLKDAVLGLDPYEGTAPPIWLAAHGPRMLKICGRLADGWLPTNIKPEAYGEKLATIRRSRGSPSAAGAGCGVCWRARRRRLRERDAGATPAQKPLSRESVIERKRGPPSPSAISVS